MIVCLGTTPTMQRTMLFDRVELDSVNRATEVREYASGKSVNVAKVLHTLGHDPVATGFVGGPRGILLREHLEREGVRHDFVEVAAPMRLCTTIVDRSNGAVTELVEEAAPVDAESWRLLAQKLEELLPLATTWVFSGSIAAGAPADFYAKCLGKLRGKNPNVIVDARGEPLREALRQPGVVAKCNREEFEATIGRELNGDSELRAAMEEAAPQGGSLIVTLGRDGTLACVRGKFWRAKAPPVKTLSAVGSGDAFAAGLAAGLDRPSADSTRAALALATACGAANAMTEDSGWVRPSDLGEILPKVVVEEA